MTAFVSSATCYLHTRDKLNNYRQIIQDIVAKYAQSKPSYGEIEPIQICDVEHDNYLLMGNAVVQYIE